MAKHGGLAWRVALAILLGASVLLSAPALGARVDAADANPVAGLKDAKVAFDITAGDAGRVLTSSASTSAASPCAARRWTRPR